MFGRACCFVCDECCPLPDDAAARKSVQYQDVSHAVGPARPHPHFHPLHPVAFWVTPPPSFPSCVLVYPLPSPPKCNLLPFNQPPTIFPQALSHPRRQQHQPCFCLGHLLCHFAHHARTLQSQASAAASTSTFARLCVVVGFVFIDVDVIRHELEDPFDGSSHEPSASGGISVRRELRTIKEQLNIL